MLGIKIYIFHTGKVCVSPNLPFGGDNCNPIKASGIFEKKEKRLWLPVSSYLIEHLNVILNDVLSEHKSSQNGQNI